MEGGVHALTRRGCGRRARAAPSPVGRPACGQPPWPTTQEAREPRMSDTTAIESLEPQPVWRLFAQIAQVPRPSKKEARIQTHVQTWAREHGFPVRPDRAGHIA